MQSAVQQHAEKKQFIKSMYPTINGIGNVKAKQFAI